MKRVILVFSLALLTVSLFAGAGCAKKAATAAAAAADSTAAAASTVTFPRVAM